MPPLMAESILRNSVAVEIEPSGKLAKWLCADAELRLRLRLKLKLSLKLGSLQLPQLYLYLHLGPKLHPKSRPVATTVEPCICMPT
ncbi:hypothetical protein M5D96_001553 [Drosophila gunungcola]|uniref:Uncharacterized protein n=1 Tax=Drosophila gunungcola TaxID=103775 RepID=A0A9P9YYU9_9MUSC|nr:hypothetical protein M5D96_001553 [Drosophila gunungcola]